MNKQAPVANDTISRGATLVKLLAFSACIALLPISTFYWSQKYIWNGDATYAAITAILVANGILIAYIITSLLDDRRETKVVKEAEGLKKEQ